MLLFCCLSIYRLIHCMLRTPLLLPPADPKKGVIGNRKSRICGFFCMLIKHDGIRFY